MRFVDFKELAKFRVEEYKNAVNTDGCNYVSTLYVCIDRFNEVLCSMTPHVLNDAEKCILIHKRSELAVTNWYNWYNVDYINEEGCVLKNNLEGGFKIEVIAVGSYANQVMQLQYENTTLFECRPPWEDNMGKLWQIYVRAKKCTSKQSIELLAELIEKDEKIIELEDEIKNFKFSNYLLEKQKKQYKKLLDEIKELVENKQ